MHLIVPFLFPPAHFLQAALQGLRLPALETLVARGRQNSTDDIGLEAALCRAWGVERQLDWPWAPLSLPADGGTPDRAYWLRTDPVHIRILRDRLILLGSELLDIHPDEAAALCVDLHAHFGAAFYPLPLQPDRWYCRLEQDPRLETTPLSLAVGRPIDHLLPHGANGPTWRSLLNEIQMLLANHPVNQRREAGDLPVINSVWPWGGGRGRQPAAISRSFHCADDHLRSVAQHLRMRTPAWTDRPEGLEADGLVLLNQLQPSGQYGDLPGWRAAASVLDESWLGPLIKRGISLRIEDPVAGSVLDFSPRDRWKLWRRLKPLAAGEQPLALPEPPPTMEVDEFGNTLGN